MAKKPGRKKAERIDRTEDKKLIPTDEHAVLETFYELPYDQRTYAELAKKFKLPDDKYFADRLGDIIRINENDGCVHHAVLKQKSDFLPRNPRLEEMLRHNFKLRQAVVVDISSLGPPVHTPAADPGMWATYDDNIHSHLGRWAARVLVSNLRPGDVVATGGGRGPNETAKKVDVSGHMNFIGDIVPLTGRIGAGFWYQEKAPDKKPKSLDADDVAYKIHGKIRTSGRVRWTDGANITELKQPPATGDVNVAIVGIGALGGGHRVHQHEQFDELRTVSPLLKEINRLATRLEKKCAPSDQAFFHPVGDVCNFYFPVPGENGASQAPEWGQLADKLRELNAAFKSIPLADLEAVARKGVVLAVAGGPHKSFAIQKVLRQNITSPQLTHLITDHVSARWILQRENEPLPPPGA